MIKQKVGIMLVAVLCIALLASYVLTVAAQPEYTGPSKEDAPDLHIPEISLGTVGVLGALATAFAVFAVAKRRK